MIELIKLFFLFLIIDKVFFIKMLQLFLKLLVNGYYFFKIVVVFLFRFCFFWYYYILYKLRLNMRGLFVYFQK